MIYAVYEVELEPIVQGQHFCQHVKAPSAEEAVRRVQEKQGRKAIKVKMWRKCYPHELDAARQSGDLK